MKLTKIEVASAHLISAVRLYFQGGAAASVYLLAASAREMLTAIGEKTGEITLLREVSESSGRSLKELKDVCHEYANFLKHADRDPTATLEIPDRDVEVVLYVACHDFGRIAKGMPIELQVYQAWALAPHWKNVSEAPLRLQPTVRKLRRFFPGLTNMTTQEAQKIGWTKLHEAMADSSLQMKIQTEVVLPDH